MKNRIPNIYYIPIICCGQAMAEIYDGEKRVAASCPICKRVWKQPADTTSRFNYRIAWGMEKTSEAPGTLPTAGASLRPYEKGEEEHRD